MSDIETPFPGVECLAGQPPEKHAMAMGIRAVVDKPLGTSGADSGSEGCGDLFKTIYLPLNYCGNLGVNGVSHRGVCANGKRSV